MDIDSIPYGVDFRTQIAEALRYTDVLVAIIGPRWTGTSRGRRARILEDNDPVRVEVERALVSGIAVVPVLVNGARTPKVTDLPDSLKDLSYRNAADAGRDFHQHLDRLIRSMDQILLNPGAHPSPSAAATDAPRAQVDEGVPRRAISRYLHNRSLRLNPLPGHPTRPAAHWGNFGFQWHGGSVRAHLKPATMGSGADHRRRLRDGTRGHLHPLPIMGLPITGPGSRRET